MDNDAFRKWSHRAADWGADYRQTVGRAARACADAARRDCFIRGGQPAGTGRADGGDLCRFRGEDPPGMTHWQHPRFFAYFPANAAPVSVVAEYLVSAMAAQCMLWQTSPAATELEIKVVDWMRQALGLPEVCRRHPGSGSPPPHCRGADHAEKVESGTATGTVHRTSRACASMHPTRSTRP